MPAKSPFAGFRKKIQDVVNRSPVDEGYINLVKDTQRIAKDYRQNLPELQRKSYNLQGDISRRNLAKSLTDANRAASRRGMLYGGVASGLRSNAREREAANLASRVYDQNKYLSDTARDLEDLALKSGFDLRRDEQAAYDQRYNEALSRRAREGQLLNNLLGGIAGGVGGLIGRSGGSSSRGQVLGGQPYARTPGQMIA